MKIISQEGKEIQTHDVEFCMNIVSCRPDKDRRRKEILGTYDNRLRAAQVQADIYYANQEGKTEFVMPQN